MRLSWYPLAFTVCCSVWGLGQTSAQSLLLDRHVLPLSTHQPQTSRASTLALRNSGNKRLIIQQLTLHGEDAARFVLQTPVTCPFEIAPRQTKTLAFYILPDTRKYPALLEADLTIQTQGGSQRVMLKGLVAEGLEGEKEPPLQLIAEALGYAVDVGSHRLAMGMEAPRLGAEVDAPLFVRADPGRPVTLTPAARYSPAAAVPFGYYYRNNQRELRYVKMATLSGEGQQHQTLFPQITSGDTTFTPVDILFGIFVSAHDKVLYSEDALNEQPHTLRVYPLLDHRNQRIADSFLVCFEEAQNGDYQDYVFVLHNVKIVPRP